MVTKAGESAAIFFLVLSSFAANVVAPTTSELEDMYSAAAQELEAGHYREALKKLDVTEFGYAMPLQLWVQAVAAGLRIVEHPVPLVYLDEVRSFGGSLDDGRRRLAYYREVIEREMARLSVSCGGR